MVLRIPTGRKRTSWRFTRTAKDLNLELLGKNLTCGQSGNFWQLDIRRSWNILKWRNILRYDWNTLQDTLICQREEFPPKKSRNVRKSLQKPKQYVMQLMYLLLLLICISSIFINTWTGFVRFLKILENSWILRVLVQVVESP